MQKVTIYYGVSLYTNRIILEDLADATSSQSFSNINFIQGDGITASLTLNGVNSDTSPSYLTVFNEEDSPLSYWWVTSSYKNRQGQFTLGLRRDFLRQYWSDIQSSPFLCEKASTIPDSVSYASYRKSMSLSQIKTSSSEIKDNDHSNGWLIGYVARTMSSESQFTPMNEIAFSHTEYSDVLGADFTPSAYKKTADAPYDIFAIPYGSAYGYTYIVEDSSGTQTTCNATAEECLKVAQMIANEMGSAIYDIQLLPYCTFRYLDDFSILSSFSSVVNVFTTSANHKGCLFWLETSNGTQRILDSQTTIVTFPSVDVSSLTNLEKRKHLEKNYYRLVSPNYSTQFEFQPEKNAGFHSVTVRIGLKPYQPYIYVEPTFALISAGGFYGANFNDGRGLILGGDFSITMTGDAWNSYQLSNKNYQLMFDRQIQSLDLRNTYADKLAEQQLAQDIVNATTGTISGAASGAIAGTMIMPGIGTAIGAAIGGTASAAAGVTDTVINAQNRQSEKAIRDDARQASIDQFQYQIGNIQALPNTLTKVSAINPSFKIFPILESYQCSGSESTNLDLSIKYNGIDINMVASLSDFSEGYVKGSILQLPEALPINDQQARAINAELQYGVYIKEVV